MEPTTLWFFYTLGILSVAGLIGGILTKKRVRNLSIIVGIISGASVTVSVLLLYYLDCKDCTLSYRILHSFPYGIVAGLIAGLSMLGRKDVFDKHYNEDKSED